MLCFFSLLSKLSHFHDYFRAYISKLEASRKDKENRVRICSAKQLVEIKIPEIFVVKKIHWNLIKFKTKTKTKN